MRKRIFAALASAAFLLPMFSPLYGGEVKGDFPKDEKTHLELLSRIYREVMDLGSHPDDILLNRQFFVGQDDDDTNKDILAQIMIHPSGDKNTEKMILQITTYERRKTDRVVGIAKDSRTLSCLVKKDVIEIIKNEIDSRECGPLLKGVIKAIHDKKKLLALIKK